MALYSRHLQRCHCTLFLTLCGKRVSPTWLFRLHALTQSWFMTEIPASKAAEFLCRRYKQSWVGKVGV